MLTATLYRASTAPFFFSSRRRHTRLQGDWSSDVCSSDLHKIKSVYLLTETAGGFFPRFGFRAIPRDAVDPAVQRSVEFTSACPTSALVMVKQVSGVGRQVSGPRTPPDTRHLTPDT